MTLPATIFRSDYAAPSFLITHVDLRFEMYSEHTLVTAVSTVNRQDTSAVTLVLDGDKDMALEQVMIDGIATEQYAVIDDKLHLSLDQDSAQLTIVTRIYPHKNTRLEGLYKSSSMYCTQCEAEGFRCITFFQDRPDNLATYSVRIEADKDEFRVLLANGNFVDSGELPNNRHFAQWHDPFKKPSYLFACVAGDLEVVEDSFTTMSGKQVLLQLYVEAKDLDKTNFAMQCIKDAMVWDESHYGREYDLERFMVVAVDDFNMGAMENKGLNIFNTSCVLAHPDTTLDLQYERVDSIIAHEYFHNWSGNRVTCRDWFQLSLKEGFTVFRDGQYTATKGSSAVKRIDDAKVIRGMQFAEDAGPMAHPIRPESYIEINNFYTLTVYEKGAEVIGMLHRLLGEAAFRKGSDLYFDRHDGTAATCDEFVQSMADASGVDLSQFKRWYSQAGTPTVTANYQYDAGAKQMHLTLQQSIDSRFANDFEPLVIPVDIAWVDAAGVCLFDGQQSTLLTLTELEQTYRFDIDSAAAIPVLMRDFSAPVKLKIDYSVEQLGYIAAHEQDGFARFDALQRLYAEAVVNQSVVALDAIVIATKAVLAGNDQPALKALLITPPDISLLMADIEQANPLQIDRQLSSVINSVANQLVDQLLPHTARLVTDPLDMGYEAIATRSYLAAIQRLLAASDSVDVNQLATMVEQGGNLTERMIGLRLLADLGDAAFTEQAERFAQRWAHEGLVLNHWLGAVGRCKSANAIDLISEHFAHSLFDMTNPNKVRSLLGALSVNTPVFHDETGAGYQFYAKKLLALDAINPQMAARLAAPLSRFKQFDEQTAARMQQAVTWLSEHQLSNDLFEIVSKSLS